MTNPSQSKRMHWFIVFYAMVSMITVAYVARLRHPSLYGAAVKVMPCLALLLYVWLTQLHESGYARNKDISTTQELLKLIGLTSNENYEKQKPRNMKGKQLDETKAKLKTTLKIGMARGLIFSMIGDALLIWQDEEAFFIAGMVAFAVAQMSYVHGLGFKRVSWLSGVIVYSTSVLVIVLLLAKAPLVFRIAVPFYAALLATTVWRAMERVGIEDGRPPHQAPLMVVGTILFVVSDATIALDKFVLPIAPVLVQSIILSTYFMAQGFLTMGAV